MATEAQKKHLEKAREARNENQAQLTLIKTLQDRVDELAAIGRIFKDEGMSYTRYAAQIQSLRNTWPELYDELVNLFGPTPY